MRLPTTATARDGRTVLLRHPVAEDAEAMIEAFTRVAAEDVFIARTPEDVRSVDEQRRFIASLGPDSGTTVLALVDGALAGFGGVHRPALRKLRHTASVGILLVPEHRGAGIGRLIMQALEAWARDVGVQKLDLGVFALNARARRLYERLGYEVEGVRKRQYLVAGELVDEVLMAKWIGT